MSEGDQRIHQFPQVICAIVPQSRAVEKVIEVLESVGTDQELQLLPVPVTVLLNLALYGVIVPVSKLSGRHAILADFSVEDDVIGWKTTVISRPAASRVGRGVEIKRQSRLNSLDAIVADDIGPSRHTQISTVLPNGARILHDEVTRYARPVGHLERGVNLRWEVKRNEQRRKVS